MSTVRRRVLRPAQPRATADRASAARPARRHGLVILVLIAFCRCLWWLLRLLFWRRARKAVPLSSLAAGRLGPCVSPSSPEHAMIENVPAGTSAAFHRRDGPAGNARILVVVEGLHDVRFLRRIGRLLHGDDPALPDLAAWEQAGQLVFVPTSGGDLMAWSYRLAALGLPEFHLYDRELMPETAARAQAAARVNLRPGCRAVITVKRSLENYLDRQAIQESRGIDLVFDDDDDVPDLAARHCFALREGPIDWDDLPRRHRKRLRERAKHWLNRHAAECMTVARLAERDPAGEVRGWLRVIADLAGSTRGHSGLH